MFARSLHARAHGRDQGYAANVNLGDAMVGGTVGQS